MAKLIRFWFLLRLRIFCGNGFLSNIFIASCLLLSLLISTREPNKRGLDKVASCLHEANSVELARHSKPVGEWLLLAGKGIQSAVLTVDDKGGPEKGTGLLLVAGDFHHEPAQCLGLVDGWILFT